MHELRLHVWFFVKETKPKLELIYTELLLIALMLVRVKEVWLDNDLSYLQVSSEAHAKAISGCHDLKDLKVQLLKRNNIGGVHFVDFQKCGLPHAHFLQLMRPTHRMNNPDDYDKIMCTEIPDPIKYPTMHDLFMRKKVHVWRVCPKKCRFRYRRQLNDKTSLGEDSYPLYRRRNN
uniref:Helitron helicase-like domain-containing protein n=1 Tax=Lactuca sativa TaxID=4236 RepID=A0A9R1X5W7_LACSA|nr:hypothetical protein LSAT_V11C600309850 [Lactuca sativa]